MNKSTKISTFRAIAGAVSAILILIVSQIIAMAAGIGITALGIPSAVGNIVSAFLYPLIAIAALKLLCEKLLKVSLSDCRITRYRLKPVWVISAFIMPAIVVGGLLLTKGHWENSEMNSEQIADSVTTSVFIAGLAVGAVEEAVFRGVVMKALEIRWNKWVAVIVPSVIFGAIHIIGGGMDIISFIQLVIAGSIVGILFSLAAYESGSVWSGAFMHSIWNMFMASGILNIGTEPSETNIFNYVLETDSNLISGGDFGAEASVISIGAYLIFTILAIFLIKKKAEFKQERAGK